MNRQGASEVRDPETRHTHGVRFKGKSITWLETTADKHGIERAEFARELFRRGSVDWMREHPDDRDLDAQRA